MSDPKPLRYLSPAQFETLVRADALLAEAGLPSASAVIGLLATARSLVVAPATAHDDVQSALDLVEQIDYVLAGVPLPGISTQPLPALH